MTDNLAAAGAAISNANTYAANATTVTVRLAALLHMAWLRHRSVKGTRNTTCCQNADSAHDLVPNCIVAVSCMGYQCCPDMRFLFLCHTGGAEGGHRVAAAGQHSGPAGGRQHHPAAVHERHKRERRPGDTQLLTQADANIAAIRMVTGVTGITCIELHAVQPTGS